MKLKRKGGAHGSVAVHPHVASRIEAYLLAAGHKEDLKGPLFRPVRDNQLAEERSHYLYPRQVDRIFKQQ